MFRALRSADTTEMITMSTTMTTLTLMSSPRCVRHTRHRLGLITAASRFSDLRPERTLVSSDNSAGSSYGHSQQAV